MINSYLVWGVKVEGNITDGNNITSICKRRFISYRFDIKKRDLPRFSVISNGDKSI